MKNRKSLCHNLARYQWKKIPSLLKYDETNNELNVTFANSVYNDIWDIINEERYNYTNLNKIITDNGINYNNLDILDYATKKEIVNSIEDELVKENLSRLWFIDQDIPCIELRPMGLSTLSNKKEKISEHGGVFLCDNENSEINHIIKDDRLIWIEELLKFEYFNLQFIFALIEKRLTELNEDVSKYNICMVTCRSNINNSIRATDEAVLKLPMKKQVITLVKGDEEKKVYLPIVYSKNTKNPTKSTVYKKTRGKFEILNQENPTRKYSPRNKSKTVKSKSPENKSKTAKIKSPENTIPEFDLTPKTDNTFGGKNIRKKSKTKKFIKKRKRNK